MGHWGSHVGGSLTNRLLMVATVSAGEMGEVSGAKQSSKRGGGEGAHILWCIIPTRVHPSLQLPPSTPPCSRWTFREERATTFLSRRVCFEMFLEKHY